MGEWEPQGYELTLTRRTINPQITHKFSELPLIVHRTKERQDSNDYTPQNYWLYTMISKWLWR